MSVKSTLLYRQLMKDLAGSKESVVDTDPKSDLKTEHQAGEIYLGVPENVEPHGLSNYNLGSKNCLSLASTGSKTVTRKLI